MKPHRNASSLIDVLAMCDGGEKMKSWFASKTIIVNALTLAASLLTVASGSDLVQQYPKVAAGIVATLAVINIGLRFITSVPIG